MNDDTISRQAAIDAVMRKPACHPHRQLHHTGEKSILTIAHIVVHKWRGEA